MKGYNAKQREVVYDLCLSRNVKIFKYLKTLRDKSILVEVKTTSGKIRRYTISPQGALSSPSGGKG